MSPSAGVSHDAFDFFDVTGVSHMKRARAFMVAGTCAASIMNVGRNMVFFAPDYVPLS
ncbi:hypothetical protein PSAB6_30402 [Paraburkholderia sabiae]|nr:hypothetical protein PSAB6_30402 [Paraburkholderia sabiae]